MFIRSLAGAAAQGQKRSVLLEDTVVQPELRPAILRFTALILLCWTMLILGVMAVARTGTIPRLVDPPQPYLPGNPLPSGVTRTSHTTYVYWGTRIAHLYTGSYRPDSPVLFVVWVSEPKQASPWRGFRRRSSPE